MSIKEFMGHCFCDSRFQQLREMISTGTLDVVLHIQQLNNELKRNHRHQEINSLLKERLG
jgi:hypothetical protein